MHEFVLVRWTVTSDRTFVDPVFEKFSRYLWIPIFILFVILALDTLSSQGIDKDEIITFENVMRPLDELIVNRLDRGHAPLYFVLVHGWLKLTGPSHVMMILPSVALGWLAVVGMVWLARRLGWGAWSWLVGCVFAFHPTFIYFARYARPWIGVLCIGIWILICWLRLLDEDTPTRRRGLWGTAFWALGIAGALWNHALLIIWVLLIVGMLCSPTLRRRNSRRVYWGIIVAILAHLFMTGLVIIHAAGLTAVSWIKPPSWVDLTELVLEWLGGAHASFDVRNGDLRIGDGRPVILGCLLLGLIVAGAIELYWRPRARRMSALPLDTDWKRAATRLVCAAGWAPALVILCSPIVGHPVTLFRYGILALPGLLLLACRGSRWLPGRALPVGCLGVLIILNLVNYPPSVRARRTGMRQAINRLEKKIDPKTDIVLVTTGSAMFAVQLFLPNAPLLFIDRTNPNKQAWEQFVAGTRNYQRVWIYDLYTKGGLYFDPQFTRLMGRHKHRFETKGATLYEYDRVPAMIPNLPAWQPAAGDSSNPGLKPDTQNDPE